MDLSQNNITGTLLHWSEELRKLRHLSLEGNKFFGQIPSSIGNLSMLKDLCLPSNNFNGYVAILILSSNGIHQSSFQMCQYFVDLNLSYNHLAGRIPKQCKGDQGQQQDNKNRSMVSLYFVIVLGSGIGVSGVVGTLTEELRSNVGKLYSKFPTYGGHDRLLICSSAHMDLKGEEAARPQTN